MAVDRLLALDKRDRYPTGDAALRALAPFSAGDHGSLRLTSIVDALLPAPRASAHDVLADPSRRTLTAAPSSHGDRVAYGPAPVAPSFALNEAPHDAERS